MQLYTDVPYSGYIVMCILYKVIWFQFFTSKQTGYYRIFSLSFICQNQKAKSFNRGFSVIRLNFNYFYGLFILLQQISIFVKLMMKRVKFKVVIELVFLRGQNYDKVTE